MLGDGFEEIPAPNERTKTLRKDIIIYMIVFGVCILMKFSIGMFPIQDLFSVLLLWCGYRTLNYCCMSFFVLMSMFNFFELVSTIGKAVQNGTKIFNKINFLNSVIILFCIGVYIWGFYICLMCYREFKGLMKEGVVRGGGMRSMAGGLGRRRGGY